MTPQPFPLVTKKEIPVQGTFDPTTRLTISRTMVRGAKFPVIVIGSGASGASQTRPSRVTSAYSAKQDAERLGVESLNKNFSLWQLFLAYRRSVLRVEPNEVHRSISRFIAEREAGVILDLNTDGLLQQITIDRMVQLRGSIWRNECTRCKNIRMDQQCEATDPEDGSSYYTPNCPRCGRTERPDVLLSDEPMESRYESQLIYAQRALAQADVIVLIGVNEPDCPEPLFEALRPLAKSKNGMGIGSRQFVIEITGETRKFETDFHLIGKLPYLARAVFAL